MTSWEAPAKLNLSLLVSPPRDDGYHPIRSVAQTVDWCDEIQLQQSDEGRDVVDVSGADIEPVDNLVTRALRAVRKDAEVPPFAISLAKHIPIEAGLGGGSSNAAAVLAHSVAQGWLAAGEQHSKALEIGADVPMFLRGGSVLVSGIGEEVEAIEPLSGFAFAVVVPGFGLSTQDVYRRWDELEGPEGESVSDHHLPPQLRDGMPMRNDLLPAAVDLEPHLAELMAEIRQLWDSAVCLTGSGSACFGYFPSVDEASGAVEAVSHLIFEGRGVALRDRGVAQL